MPALLRQVSRELFYLAFSVFSSHLSHQVTVTSYSVLVTLTTNNSYYSGCRILSLVIMVHIYSSGHTLPLTHSPTHPNTHKYTHPDSPPPTHVCTPLHTRRHAYTHTHTVIPPPTHPPIVFRTFLCSYSKKILFLLKNGSLF